MGEGSDLSGHICVLGGSVAACFGDFGAGVLLGVYEGQPASAKLHIKEVAGSIPAPSQKNSNGFTVIINLHLFIV